MPAVSEAQRRYLNARFGHDWVKAHHFDNIGRLPSHVHETKSRSKGKLPAHIERAARQKMKRKRKYG